MGLTKSGESLIRGTGPFPKLETLSSAGFEDAHCHVVRACGKDHVAINRR